MEQITPPEVLQNEPPQDRPELLITLRKQGIRCMSDAQLLALVICGAVGETQAWKASVRLYHAVGRSFHGLKWLNQADLERNGLTERQGAALLAAMEIGRRRAEVPPQDRPTVSTSSGAYDLLKGVLCDLPHEEFWMLMLDRGMRHMATQRVSIGGMHGTVADPKCIFKLALDQRASAIIIAHNHPSGQLRPSSEDLSLTKKLVEGGRLLDIEVQDHLIIGHDAYLSLRDSGQM